LSGRKKCAPAFFARKPIKPRKPIKQRITYKRILLSLCVSFQIIARP